MNVKEYFEQAFPGHTYEQSRDAEDLASMPLDSTCGDSCRGAIDAATRFADHVRMAHGDFPKGQEMIRRIRNTVVDVCGVYICG